MLQISPSPFPSSRWCCAARHKHPAIAVGHYLAADRFAITMLVLLAALPRASNVSLLAERFGADNGRIARIILVSMAAAFVTFSLAVSWLR